MTQFLRLARPVPLAKDFVFVDEQIPRPPFYKHFILSNKLFYNHAFSLNRIVKIHDEIVHLIQDYNSKQHDNIHKIFLVVMEDTFKNGDKEGQPCLSFVLSQYYRENKKLCGLYCEHDDFDQSFINISLKINSSIVNTFMSDASQAEKSLSQYRFKRHSNNMFLQISDPKLCKLDGILLA